MPKVLVKRAMQKYRPPLVATPCVLNTAELATLAAIPTGEAALLGLDLGSARQLAPSPDIPARGRVVVQANFPGSKRPLALSVPDSLRHLHVLGPTGVGKSTLLSLITQDMQAGRGVVVVDPKDDLASDVLDRMPQERVGDVVVLDLIDVERPVGLNVLAGAHQAPDLVSDQIPPVCQALRLQLRQPHS
ncbi:helicase HerA domain-containing protein [Actinomadura kijaniata]|uniref:helicase HerA domain-containing protein n=1 Tax=Actinomadura kijaniata TaxID=46161 RepID=UPI003F1C73C8